MRKRTIRIQFWLNKKEAELLDKKVKRCGLTREAYLRHLVAGFAPKEAPPPDYYSMMRELYGIGRNVPFPVSWTVKMKKKQKETQDILSYHTQAAGCSDKARAKASGGRQPIEECGRTGL